MSGVGSNETTSGSETFISTWLTPTSQCITRKGPHRAHEVTLEEGVVLSTKELKRCRLMVVYIHHPNQLIRSLGSTGNGLYGNWAVSMVPPDEYALINNSSSLQLTTFG